MQSERLKEWSVWHNLFPLFGNLVLVQESLWEIRIVTEKFIYFDALAASLASTLMGPAPLAMMNSIAPISARFFIKLIISICATGSFTSELLLRTHIASCGHVQKSWKK